MFGLLKSKEEKSRAKFEKAQRELDNITERLLAINRQMMQEYNQNEKTMNIRIR